MLRILKENHLALFDQKRQYITAFTFQIVEPDTGKNRSPNEHFQLSEEYPITLNIMEKFQFSWESEYFDLEVLKNETTEYGSIPFSLETFLELYKDPRIWDIVLKPKSDELELEELVDKLAGKLVIRTKFTSNPFILPVQSRQQHLQSLKTIKVITEAGSPQKVFSSGELVDKVTVQEVDIWAFTDDPQEGYSLSLKNGKRKSDQGDQEGEREKEREKDKERQKDKESAQEKEKESAQEKQKDKESAQEKEKYKESAQEREKDKESAQEKYKEKESALEKEDKEEKEEKESALEKEEKEEKYKEKEDKEEKEKEKEGENKGFDVHTFEVEERVSAQNVCIIRGEFEETVTVHKNRTVRILSSGREVSFIANLEKTMKMLKFINTDMLIFQNVDTEIEEAYRIVFFTDASSIYSQIFKSFLYSKIYDEWVIEGMAHYSRDNRHFQELMQELVELMTEGEELFPLCNSEYGFDRVWKTKARFIYHVLVNVSGSNLNDWILDFAKKRKLTSPMILKKIKDNFGKEKIKTIYEQQFINSTGMARIFYEIQYIKRDHKVRLTLRQKSLQCNLFRKYNYYRRKLEEGYRCLSPLMHRILKKNEGNLNVMSGPLAVPKFLRCIPYFVGPLSIEIDGMEPIEENLQEQNLTERYLDYKASSRSKRPGSKKNEQEVVENDLWMMLDAGLVFPAVYKNESISEKLIPTLVKRTYESEIEELKVLNSISIRKHSNSIKICRELIKKLSIRQGKENSKISVKRRILQLLPNFMGNCRDTTLWDDLLSLLQLYEPVCFDYSEEGSLFLLSLIESIGNISYDVCYSSYFEEFHRIMLAISRFHPCITQDKFESIHRQLFSSMMKWVSKYSLQILEEACDFLELAFTEPRRCLSLVKIIVHNVLPYIDLLRLKPDCKAVRNLRSRIDEHVAGDRTGTIRAVQFHYRTREAEKRMKPLQFLKQTFSELEEMREWHVEAYGKCLEEFKEILSRNREQYALEAQLSVLSENQNYFLAEYLWRQMSEPVSLREARVRLAWMKIYRVFYFYFTPVITMVKLGKNLSTKEFDVDENETMEILDNIMDFVPNIKWFSVYDSSSTKERRNEQADYGRRKKNLDDYKIDFQVKNIFTDFISNNPGKDAWEDLTKETLNYLKREYENKESGYLHNEGAKKEIDSSTEEKYKRIVDKLKNFIHLLKRGNTPDNMDYPRLKKKILKLLIDSGESLELATELFSLQDKTLDMVKEQKQKREHEKNDSLKISFGSFVHPDKKDRE